MSKAQDLSELIIQITGHDEGSDKYKQAKKRVNSILKKSNIYFCSHKEINESVQNMADKFILHGFFDQSDWLKATYAKYIPKNLEDSELQNRLNIVKFLLEMSERPTQYFFEHPEEFLPPEVEEEENINWKEYLNEGFPKWEPDFDQTSISSDSFVGQNSGDESSFEQPTKFNGKPLIFENKSEDLVTDFTTSRMELLANIQHSWFKSSKVLHRPPSKFREANIGILWEEHLERVSQGLIALPKSSVISEYKVIREILYQFWNIHNSVVFEVIYNDLSVKADVTISSVRQYNFHSFITNQILPYIELMRYFQNCLKYNYNENNYPNTYKSYTYALKQFVDPVCLKLVDIEKVVKAQDQTYTLLKLSHDLSLVFEPLKMLKSIHESLNIDLEENNISVALNLICNLHNSLQFSINKLDQDIRLTLFMQSLYYYLKIVHNWLVKGFFYDVCDEANEFVLISQNCLPNSKGEMEKLKNVDWAMNFNVRANIPEECLNNGIIKLITEQVLKIGRNIHFLRLLGNHYTVDMNNETIYEKFIEKSLEEMCKFYDVEYKKDEINEETGLEWFDSGDIKFKFPVIPCEHPTEFDRLENLVDTTDGFLMKAFEEVFVEKPVEVEQTKLTLFDRISKITNEHLMPVIHFFENVLESILKEHFTISGLLAKNLLVDGFSLYKELTFLRHLFLFHDDLIFPFYNKLFREMNFTKNNVHAIWLTSNLHDVVIDYYPSFYEHCWVTVDVNRVVCFKEIVQIHYKTQWPNNIVITEEHITKYQTFFEFILQIKWALFILNNLYFTDIETKKMNKKCKAKNIVNTKLKYLKFALINLVNSIQHYILGFKVNLCQRNFELDFEKSNDLKSMLSAHDNFINEVSDVVKTIKATENDKFGFKMVMECVKNLQNLWNHKEKITLEKLLECKINFEKSSKVLNTIIYPVDLFI